MTIDDRTPPEARAAETGGLRKGWAAEMLARAEAHHETNLRTKIAEAKRRRIVRCADATPTRPSGSGKRRAVTLTLSRR